MPMGFPTPGGVDPLLKVETPMTPEMMREVPSIRSYRFFKLIPTTKDAWGSPDDSAGDPEAKVKFIDARTNDNFECSRFRINNDGAEAIEYSFDGVTVHGIMYGDESLTDDVRYERRVFVRNLVAGKTSTVRIWSW